MNCIKASATKPTLILSLALVVRRRENPTNIPIIQSMRDPWFERSSEFCLFVSSKRAMSLQNTLDPEKTNGMKNTMGVVQLIMTEVIDR